MLVQNNHSMVDLNHRAFQFKSIQNSSILCSIYAIIKTQANQYKSLYLGLSFSTLKKSEKNNKIKITTAAHNQIQGHDKERDIGCMIRIVNINPKLE
jgi:hypothetical protein